MSTNRRQRTLLSQRGLYNCTSTSMEVFNINFLLFYNYFCRTMLCKCGLSRHAASVRLSIHVSVTFVHYVKKNKHIFKKIFTFGYSQPHRFYFSVPNVIAIFYGNHPNGGVECPWDRQKYGILTQYLASSHTVNSATASCYQHDCPPIPGYRSMPAEACAIN